MSEKSKELKTGVVDIETAISTFEELRGDLGGIGIWRDGSYLGRHLPEEIDGDIIDWVKKTYGGGHYQITLYGKNGRSVKRLSFNIAGPPKEPTEESSTKKEDGTIELIKELIEKLEEKKGSSTDTVAIFQMMMEMQKQQFQLLLETMKGSKKESSLIDKFIDRVLANPAVLMGAGSGLLKLLKNVLGKKDELIELVKLAKDDPEIKEMAVSVLGAKYGAGGGIIDRILGNPELLNKTLEIVNKALTLREAGQNPLPAVKRELRELAGKREGAPQSGTAAAQVGAPQGSNPQSTPHPAVDNQVNQEVVQVQEIIAIGTKILEMAERGADAGAIWDSLSDREVDVLVAVVDQYGIRDAEGLIGFLEGLPVPRFTIAGYVEAIRRHRQVVDEFLSYCIAEELQEEGQVENQGVMQGETGQVQRENTGTSQELPQGDGRSSTGKG
jgi:hypothetical protein